MTVVTQSEIDAALAMLDEYSPPMQEKGEYTCDEWAKMRGITYNQMKARLERAVADKKMTARPVRARSGRDAVAYRPT